jgi:hypothetical protein
VANVKLPGPIENAENIDPKQLNIILLNAYNKLLKEVTFLLKNLDDRNIVAESLTADSIAANTITAVKMSVTELSAITANMGHLTAGRVTGAIIENKETPGDRVWKDSEGIHANDASGVERVALSTTPARGAKAWHFYGTSGPTDTANIGAITYDTETYGTGLYVTGPNGQTVFLENNGEVLVVNNDGYGIIIQDGIVRPKIVSAGVTGNDFSVSGDSTSSDTHNHGITSGVYIQTYDSAGNPLGLELFSSNTHSHTIT